MAFPSAALIDEIGGGDKGVAMKEDNGENMDLRGVQENGVVGVEEDETDNVPLRYVPLCDVYSATSPCVSSASGGSKKVKPPNHQNRKSLNHFNRLDHLPGSKPPQLLPAAVAGMDNAIRERPPLTKFYVRRVKLKCKLEKDEEESFISDAGQSSQPRGSSPRNHKRKAVVEEKLVKYEEDEGNFSESLLSKRRRKLEDGSVAASFRMRSTSGAKCNNVDRPQTRGMNKSKALTLRNCSKKYSIRSKSCCETKKGKNNNNLGNEVDNLTPHRSKKWVWLSIHGVDPNKFVGLQCKVFWPLDADWFPGRICGYVTETGRHMVKYDDGDEEKLILASERIRFLLSAEEIERLKLKRRDKCAEGEGIDVSDMMVLAASLDNCEDLEPGDIMWAKLTGHAMWPALVMDEALAGQRKGLSKISGEKSVLVQFFGTHDFARIKTKQIISFLRGLLSSFHLKCKKPKFVLSLEEAKMYLGEQKLPEGMLIQRNAVEADVCKAECREDEGHAGSGKACVGGEETGKRLGNSRCYPMEIGDFKIISLGKIVKDSNSFQDENHIWPEGYTVLRRFHSVTDPNVYTSYKMEVLRDDKIPSRPLFRVTSENGEQFTGPNPSACWNKIYKRIQKLQPDGLKTEGGLERIFESGIDMFGFSHPDITKLVQELATTKRKGSKTMMSKYQEAFGYRPVDVKWKDLDKCNVCHMDEEYEDNLFLQCDKCRMMVHARCYGELEPVGGVLWLCNLCRPGAPDVPPLCVLCPVTGGAMKPTTDGRWAHLACAIWIPETCLSDIKKMEPIDGLSRVNKDRWKLICSICGVSYGACIQCSNHNCYVAYHPLCARAAGFCIELEDEDRLNLIPVDEDVENQSIRLLSYCKRHRPISDDRLAADERTVPKVFECSEYIPPLSSTGCSRTEPYNYLGRRGRKEPEALAAASLKRLYVENRPHVVGGFSQHMIFGNSESSSAVDDSKPLVDLQHMRLSQLDTSTSFSSMDEKYNYMRTTLRKRLSFGKSRIHGFGIFAKYPHKAGDMVIEYTGEIVRPSIADRREHLIYNSLVGAGTYMFRIDDQRVVDATRAGSIAHLINHSCEPNCYSRVITVNSDEHIIIFAKRDIVQWEELTYDYRFMAIDEQLACCCGFPRCRGVVNDTEAEERAIKRTVPRGDLIEWNGE